MAYSSDCIAEVEFTDTFGGEANYCWVQRAEFPCDGLTDLQIMRRAKAAIGQSGSRSVADKYGDQWRLDFPGRCVVAFVTFRY